MPKWDFMSAWVGAGFKVSHPLVPLQQLFTVRWELATGQQLDGGEVSMVDRVGFDGEVYAGTKQETRMEQYIALPGDVIVSKIRARQGSVGVVQSHQGKVSVSIHYRVLIPNADRVDVVYAWLALRSAYCRAQFMAATGGAMKGEISEEALLDIRLPLPSLDQQRVIVRQWQDAQAAAQAARREADRLEQQAARDFLHGLGLAAPDEAKRRKAFAVNWSDFERWGMEWNQQRVSGVDPEAGKFSTVVLGSVLDLVQYGTSEKANQEGNGLPVLRMNNIKAGLLDTTNLKHINLPHKARQGLLLRDGDILIIRTNGSRDLVGTCAVFHENGEYVFASYLIRLRVDQKRLNPDFVVYFLNSPLGRAQVNAVSRQIMQNNINSKELRGLRLPLPPLKVQQDLVAAITAARRQAAQARAEAGSLKIRTAANIEATLLGIQA